MEAIAVYRHLQVYCMFTKVSSFHLHNLYCRLHILHLMQVVSLRLMPNQLAGLIKAKNAPIGHR